MKSEDQPFRFFDNREKYLLFVTTTSEKAITAEHVGREFDWIKPKPPALKIFDAGVGNGMVLSRILCEMHCRFPSVPFFVVGKEISLEDTRLCLEKLADRFYEHPQMVVILTNLYYAEAPWLEPAQKSARDQQLWWDVPLEGNTVHEFSKRITQLDMQLQRCWKQNPVSSQATHSMSSPLLWYSTAKTRLSRLRASFRARDGMKATMI